MDLLVERDYDRAVRNRHMILMTTIIFALLSAFFYMRADQYRESRDGMIKLYDRCARHE